MTRRQSPLAPHLLRWIASPTSASELHKLREPRWRTGTEPWRTCRTRRAARTTRRGSRRVAVPEVLAHPRSARGCRCATTGRGPAVSAGGEHSRRGHLGCRIQRSAAKRRTCAPHPTASPTVGAASSDGPARPQAIARLLVTVDAPASCYVGGELGLATAVRRFRA